MTTKETSAYIKGLVDGSGLDTSTPEGKVIAALVDLCGKLADEVESLTEALDTANDYLDELDHDLGEVEELVYDIDDDDDEGCCKCGRGSRSDEDIDDDFDDFDDEDEEDDEDEDEDDEEEEEFYCATCPNCGGKVYFDDTVNPEDVICPACHKPLIDEEEEDDESEGV